MWYPQARKRGTRWAEDQACAWQGPNRANGLRGSFYAAFFIVCADNVSVTFYFYAKYFSVYTDNVSMTFYFYAMFSSVNASNESMTLVVLIFLLENLA